MPMVWLMQVSSRPIASLSLLRLVHLIGVEFSCAPTALHTLSQCQQLWGVLVSWAARCDPIYTVNTITVGWELWHVRTCQVWVLAQRSPEVPAPQAPSWAGPAVGNACKGWRL